MMGDVNLAHVSLDEWERTQAEVDRLRADLSAAVQDECRFREKWGEAVNEQAVLEAEVKRLKEALAEAKEDAERWESKYWEVE